MSHQDITHASCVAHNGSALLIFGKSGSGKSSLALDLISRGARLVSDDRCILEKDGAQVSVRAPEATEGLIEARGIGVLNADICPLAAVAWAVDLDHVERDRIPESRTLTILGQNIPLLYRVEGIHFAAGLWQLMRCGRSNR